MITRRDALKIATSLAAARTVAPQITRAEAAKRLNEPLDAGDPLALPADTNDLHNPAVFADEMSGYQPFDDIGRSLFEYIAPKQHATYLQQHAALLASMPFLEDLPPQHPFSQIEGLMYDWVLAAYYKGISDGAAYEHLRLALAGATQVCHRCDGRGLVQVDDGRWWHRGPATGCPDCLGKGVLTDK